MLNERLRKLRKMSGYSQEQIARKLSVTQGAVSQWERGATVPASEQLLALADIYHVSVDDLIGRDAEKSQLDDDLYTIRERLRRDPSYRMLFAAANKASTEHIKAAAAMLKALEGNTDDD